MIEWESMNIYGRIKLKKGYITALAPMEGVTDSLFRQMICKIGRPDLFFTEFLNVEGFCSEGKEKVVHRVKFLQKEKPIVVQLWGNTPDYYEKTVRSVKKLEPDGIDINIGCSVRDILSSGKCSALIKEKDLVKEIISVVKKEAGDLPVSVKTRLGYDDIDVEGWIGFLLEQDLDLLTIHGRTSKEGYAVPAKWDEISRCVELRNEISPTALILGNGDVKSLEQGKEYVKRYGVDGFMIAREIMINPWVFKGESEISERERINILIEHLNLFQKTWGNKKPFNSQKKYIKAYIKEFDGANELRKILMDVNTREEAIEILNNFK